MTEQWEEILLLFAVSTIMVIILLLLKYIQYQREQVKAIEVTIRQAQQDRVYSISERVQPNEWSSRDAYLTVQHITAENQMNKPNYNDAPPSYEEAMRIVALTTATGESSTVVTVSTLPKEPN
ncbi:unnamed protein product [Acanthoscelides obtectus]|uniref:Uncharacterized protein n=1 Tax=Acanthoscelides obtectus TaxID=200917 RepID=A0A9P0KE89_ACAOB|nr:unnamed protein product [Acanthoscelides obtectus]CAK1657549.1 hypothetical protein AOBTE_LOCUS20413 [Acanthoscelides obtectus]